MNNKEFYPCYVNGEWLGKEHSKRIPVENPATGEIFAEVPDCSSADVQYALETSQIAQREWQDLATVERAEYIYKLVDKLHAEKEHFSRLLVMEQGKPIHEARAEVDDTIRYMAYSAEAGRRLEGQIFPTDQQNDQLMIFKVPHGVTVGLCAFNYPLALIGRKLGPALITGNTMIIKPHEQTPVTASEFCRLIDEVQFPKGVVNMLTGSGTEVGAALVKSPITQLVTMTGSIRAGQAIYATAAENITVLSLELGGNAPFIVLEDADIDKAADAAVISRFANCGQVCICNETVLVHQNVAAQFTEKVLAKVRSLTIGDPMKGEGMGPSTSATGLVRIEQIVAQTIVEGAVLLCGGKRPAGAKFEKGNWYEPTVLAQVPKNATAVKEEIFGPVMPIVTISSYEEALEIANANEGGLSAYLWTEDYRKFMHAIQHLQVGTIFINKAISGYVQGYHNGHKRSGLGGEDGIYGIEGYLQKRTVYLGCD